MSTSDETQGSPSPAPEKKAGDSGGDEAASVHDELYDLDLPLAARRVSLPVPGAFQGLSHLVEAHVWIFPVVLGWVCLGLVLGGFTGAIVGGEIGGFGCFCAFTVRSYWQARRVRVEYEARVSEEVRRETQCLFCDDDFAFGRRSDESGERIFPRGCEGCGKSVCLRCARRQDQAAGAEALPRVVKFCPRCQDAESRWELG